MKIDLTTLSLTTDDLALVQEIIKPSGEFYKAKPKKASGEAKYVWRMAMFFLSSDRKLQCIPVTAEFDLPDRYFGNVEAWEARRELVQRLDAVVDAIVDSVPPTEWRGVRRWAAVL